MSRDLEIVIGGAGLAGSLLASLLARDGHRVHVFERRTDPRRQGFTGGRSINLALSARGLTALDAIGQREAVMEHAIPMRGRIMHDDVGATSFHPYSVVPGEAINSVSRGGLNIQLLEAAEAMENVTLHFEEPVVDVDFAGGIAWVQRSEDAEPRGIKADLVVGADGAFSTIRAAMQRYPDGFGFKQEFISHGYKELVIPPTASGDFALDSNALHIWPRGQSMMIALPNADRSFTCTLFWPREGSGTTFETLKSVDDIPGFFERLYPDAVGHMPTLEQDCQDNPIGTLVTISCERWYCGAQAVLIGDAAHAIVPFFGQGMNAAFQDCLVLQDHLRQSNNDVGKAIVSFSDEQKPNGDAIAQLSMENFLVMRDKVNSRWFRLRQHLDKWLHRLVPGQVQPVYNLVSFSMTPYAEITRRQARRHRANRLVVLSLALLAAVAIAFFIGTFA